MKCSMLAVVLVAFACATEAIDFGGLGQSVLDISKGFAEQIPDAIIKPQDLFETGKNVIVGYPFNQVSQTIHFK